MADTGEYPLQSDAKQPTKATRELGFDPDTFVALFRPSGLNGNPDTNWNPPRQPKYLARYLEKLACRTIIWENHYIDRDYMEDYAAFYSRSFAQYRNSCERFHFFKAANGDSHITLAVLAEYRRQVTRKNREDREKEWENLSRIISESYLGFMVVKPLPGCPIGTTVLQSFPSDSGRIIRSLKKYTVHLAGFTLHVRGVAFQQQDKGTSACATTAIWSAVHRSPSVRSPITPADITGFATRFALPEGRAMPSEGLTVGQMCEGIRGVGLAPYLLRHNDVATTVGLLHLAVTSGMPVVAIIRKGDDKSPKLHAVTVLGGRLDEPTDSHPDGLPITHQAMRLRWIYVHDDRIGPYVKLHLVRDKKKLKAKQEKANLTAAFDENDCVLELVEDSDGRVEYWVVVSLLFPLHSKIRITIKNLIDIAEQAVKRTQWIMGAGAFQIYYELRILRGTKYVRNQLIRGTLSEIQMTDISEKLALSRYVAVVRIGTGETSLVDIVVDTTGTDLNVPVLACVDLAEVGHVSRGVAEQLASLFPGSRPILHE